MSVDVNAITGVGINLDLSDIKLLGNYDSFLRYVYANNLDSSIIDSSENRVSVVTDPYNSEYEYLMYVLINRGECDDEKCLNIDLDLSEFADKVCEKYKEIFNKDLDRSRVKLVSFLRYT